MVEVSHLNKNYGSHPAIRDLTFSVADGQVYGLLGPNGAGKSTVVNAVTQGVPYAGRIELLGRDVRRYKPRALAQRVGVLAQSHAVSYSFTVEEVVRLGRYAHAAGVFSARSAQDERKVEQALALTGLLPLAGQSVLTLSGGELQRTFLAQLLAQDPQLLILDEPTNHLDLESITSLNNGMTNFTGTMLFASKDHQLVSTVANRIIEIADGKIVFDKRMTYEEYLQMKLGD